MRSKPLPDGHPACMGLRSLKAVEYPCEAAGAAGILAPVGFVLPMSIGAILMSASTVVVALNAQLLRRIDLTPEASTRSVLERQK